MRSGLWLAVLAFILTMGWAAPAAAQEDERVDSAFSDELIHTFGYEEIEITVGPEGVEAPDTLEAGLYVVTLTASEPYIGYVNFMQPPDGLSAEVMTEMALAAGAGDMPQHDWVYAGGTNTPGVGESATFIAALRPGEYQIAASYYEPPGEDEQMTLVPLTVTEPDAETTQSSAEPPATVSLEQTDDLQYIVTPDPVPAGPQLWKISNSGEMHAHHVVMMRVPEGTTAQQITGEFNGMFAGTPPAGDSAFMQGVWVGYAALQSGGWTTWAEFDLPPATYAVVCFILDPETGRPHAADGMVTVFKVS